MKKENEKTTQHSKSNKSYSKTRPFAKNINDLLTWREYNPGEKFALEVAQNLYEWAQEEDSLDLLDFYHSFGIPRVTWLDWRKKYPKAAYIHQQVKEIIGARRQRLAMYKKNGVNEAVVTKTLHLFHPDWEEAYNQEKEFKRELKLAANDEEKNPVQVVVVKDFPTAPAASSVKDSEE